MVGKSEQLRRQAAEDMGKVASLDDKAFALAGLATIVAVLIGYAGFVAFAGEWIDLAWTETSRPAAVEITYNVLVIVGGFIWAMLAASAWMLYRVTKLRKGAKALLMQAAEVETQEKALAAKKAETAKAAEVSEVQRITQKRLEEQRQLEEAELADHAFRKAEQAQRVAKAVQDTRVERQGRDSGGSNKPGGTSTQGKGR